MKKNDALTAPIRLTGLSLALVVSWGWVPMAHALPSGGEVVGGDAAITDNGAKITQNSPRAAIDWDSFSIAKDEAVRFMQGNADSVILNRVTGTAASDILGNLTADGKVFLINPNGILFGSDAVVDTAGLFASTFDVDPAQFMNGDISVAEGQYAAIENKGKIQIGDDGFVYLIAPKVDNSGQIVGQDSANIGKVVLANDGTYEVNLGNHNLINFSVDSNAVESMSGPIGVTNATGGDIQGKTVVLSGSQADAVTSSVVDNGGITAATSLTLAGSEVSTNKVLQSKNIHLAADKTLGSNSNPIDVEPGESLAVALDSDNDEAYANIRIIQEIGVLDEGNATLTFDQGKLSSSAADHAERDELGLLEEVPTVPNIQGIDLSFAQKADGVKLDGISVDQELTVTAHGRIENVEPDIDSEDPSEIRAAKATQVQAKDLVLHDTAENASIGFAPEQQSGNPDQGIDPLLFTADSLSATTNGGDIVASAAAGKDLRLDDISTTYLQRYKNGVEQTGRRTRVILHTRAKQAGTGEFQAGGAMYGYADNLVKGGVINLQADGMIGFPTGPSLVFNHINFDAGVISAETQDGGIYLSSKVSDKNSVPLINDLIARDRYFVDAGDQGGTYNSAPALSNQNGNVRLPNGDTGEHDIVLDAPTSLGFVGRVSATRNLTIDSENGSLRRVPVSDGGAIFSAQNIDLEAAGDIGAPLDPAQIDPTQELLGPLPISSDTLSAASTNGGVFVQEDRRLDASSVQAGEGQDISVSANSGDLLLGDIASSADGRLNHVTATASDGAIRNSNAAPVKADTLSLDAKAGIGTDQSRLATDVANLSTTTDRTTQFTPGDVYVNNDSELDSLTVDTQNGDVVIEQKLAGSTPELKFRQESATDPAKTLSYTGGAAFDLDFSNRDGGIAVAGLDLDGQTIALTASDEILSAGESATLTGDQLTLTSAAIGSDGDNDRLITQTPALSVNTTGGSAYIDNGLADGDGATDLDASTTGDLDVLQSLGDLDLGVISVNGEATLNASAGGITQSDTAPRVQAGSLDLTADGIGQSADTPLRTRVANGTIVAKSIEDGGSAVYLDNIGGGTTFDVASVDDPIVIKNNGVAIVNRLKTTGHVTLNVNGAVQAGGSGATNVAGSSALDIDASSVAGSNAPLRVSADKITVDASIGGIYIEGVGAKNLFVKHAQANGGNIDLTTALNPDADIELGSVSAPGQTVTVNSGDGEIFDRRDQAQKDNATPNIEAGVAALSGNAGDLLLDVGQLVGDLRGGAKGSLPATTITNQSPFQVSSESLSNNGGTDLTITAPTITVKDTGGSTITLRDGGSLTLSATDGNVVFLNRNDTLETARKDGYDNSGNFTLTARNTSGPDDHYAGNIVAGNLTTSNGGNITLSADGNVTLGLLDAGDEGDIQVAAGRGALHDGVILDGNEDATNLIGNRVTLKANGPSVSTAQIAREQAIAEVSSLDTQVAVEQLNLATKRLELERARTRLENAKTTKDTNEATVNKYQQQYDSLLTKVIAAKATLKSAQTALEITADLVEALGLPSGIAQAIPVTGDGGAEAAEEAAKLALTIAQQVVDKIQTLTLEPLESQLGTASSNLTKSQAEFTDAKDDLETAMLDQAAKAKQEAMIDQALGESTIASDASKVLKTQAIAASRLVQDAEPGQSRAIDMTAAKPLGVQANRLDIGVTGHPGQALDGSVYLDSKGNLGLGDIDTRGDLHADNVMSNLNVVGSVEGDLVSLDAHGAIQGGGNVLIAGPVFQRGELRANSLVAKAGSGVGDGSTTPTGESGVLQTDINNLAVDAGNGGVGIVNTPIKSHPLAVTTVDGVDGIKADGDMSLTTSGDLDLYEPIIDTDLTTPATVTLDAGGAIRDQNRDKTNVTAANLKATAVGGISLDLDVDHAGVTSTGSGNIDLSNLGNIVLGVPGLPSSLGPIQTNDGSITVTAKAGDSMPGDITVGSVAAGQNGDQALTLNADGSIFDDQGADQQNTRIEAGDLTLAAGGSIGARNNTLAAGLDTTVQTLDASAHGPVTITEADDLKVKGVTTDSGDVTLVSDGGSFRLNGISATGDGANITLDAANRIDGYDADTTDITSDRVALRAGDGVAKPDQPLTLKTHELEAAGGTGAIVATNNGGDLTIGNVTPNLGLSALSGLVAAGPIVVENTNGSMTVAEHVAQQNSGSVEPSGDVWLTASGGQAIDADVVGRGGNVRIAAQGGDLIVSPGITVASNGKLDLTGQNNVALQGETTDAIAGDDVAITATQGDLTNAGSVTSQNSDVALTAGGSIASNRVDAAGTATITADGDQIDLGENSRTMAGNDLKLLADNGAIVMAAGSSATAGGNIIGRASGRATLTDVEAGGTSDISADRGITLVANGILDAGKAITLTASNGDLYMGDGSKAMAGGDLAASASGQARLTDVEVANASDIAASQGITLVDNGTLDAGTALTLAASDGDIDLGAGSTSAAHDGDLSANAGQNVTLGGGAEASASNDIAVTAGGDVALGQNSVTTADHHAAIAANGTLTMAGEAGGDAPTAATLTAGASADLSAGSDARLTDVASGTATHVAAGNGLTLAERGTVDAGTAATLEAEQGDIQLGGASATQARRGDLTAAAGGMLAVGPDAQVSAEKTATLTAGKDITFDSDSRTAAGNDLKLQADNGDIAMAAGSSATAGGDITASAAGTATLTDVKAGGMSDIAADQGVTLVPDGTLDTGAGLRVTSTDGGITMGSGSMATAGGLLDYRADKTITLTQVQSGADATITATGGRIVAKGTQTNITASGLTLASQGDIGAKAHSLTTTVDGVTADITGKGSVYLDEKNALKIGEANIANGDARVRTGGDLILNNVSAEKGDAFIDSDGSIASTSEGVLSANALTANAIRGIDLRTDVHSVDATTQQKNIHLTDRGNLGITNLRAENGDIAVSAKNNLGIARLIAARDGQVTASAGNAITARMPARIRAESVSLDAGDGIAIDPDNPLALDASTVTARTDQGDVRLNALDTVVWRSIITGDGDIQAVAQQGVASVGQIETGDGDIVLRALRGAIQDDGDHATRIVGNGLTLASDTGLGTIKTPIGTRVDRIDASVAGKGGIYLNEMKTLSGLTALTQNGDIRVVASDGDMTVERVRAANHDITLNAANGVLRAVGGTSPNVVGASLALAGHFGVGSAQQSMIVATRKLAARSTDGDIYVRNTLSVPLTVGDVGAFSGVISGGNIGLETAGNLDVERHIVAGDDITLNSGGHVLQNANIRSRSGGDIEIQGNNGVRQSDGTHTSSDGGEITYDGGSAPVQLGGMTATSDGLSDGTITITGADLGGLRNHPGSIDASIINFRIPGVDRSVIDDIVGDARKKVIVRSNGRIIGGIFGRDSRFVSELLYDSPDRIRPDGMPFGMFEPFAATHRSRLIR